MSAHGPSAAALALVDGGGRILLLAGADGRWTLPRAVPQAGEPPERTAARAFEQAGCAAPGRIRSAEPRDGIRAADGTCLYFSDDAAVAGAAVEPRWRWAEPAEIRVLALEDWAGELLGRFIRSDRYRGTVAFAAQRLRSVGVLALDRWGRVLLQLRDADLPPERSPDMWSLPGGLIDDGEAPDEAALREFEEETGQLIEELRFYRAFRVDELPTQGVEVQHIYFADPDIPEEEIEVFEGQAFRYWSPADLAGLAIPPHSRTILERFFESPAYRAMFH